MAGFQLPAGKQPGKQDEARHGAHQDSKNLGNSERQTAPEQTFLNRRKFLAALGLTAIGTTGILASRFWRRDSLYPAERNAAFQLDRPITDELIATRYNNFYEFSSQKDMVWKLVDRFQTEPWTIQITGLVSKPQTLDLFKLIRQLPLEERLYRHRCVEAWSMAVPWTGFPFKTLIDRVQPTSAARFVRLLSFSAGGGSGSKTATRLSLAAIPGLDPGRG